MDVPARIREPCLTRSNSLPRGMRAWRCSGNHRREEEMNRSNSAAHAVARASAGLYQPSSRARAGGCERHTP